MLALAMIAYNITSSSIDYEIIPTEVQWHNLAVLVEIHFMSLTSFLNPHLDNVIGHSMFCEMWTTDEEKDSPSCFNYHAN